jgi:hypothetical protein
VTTTRKSWFQSSFTPFLSSHRGSISFGNRSSVVTWQRALTQPRTWRRQSVNCQGQGPRHSSRRDRLIWNFPRSSSWSPLSYPSVVLPRYIMGARCHKKIRISLQQYTRSLAFPSPEFITHSLSRNVVQFPHHCLTSGTLRSVKCCFAQA